MTYLLHVYYESDHYEVTVRGTQIIRVVKYVGESEFRRELEYEDLNENVKLLILKEIVEKDGEE